MGFKITYGSTDTSESSLMASNLRVSTKLHGHFGMFHVTWTTFNFKRNQLETVSAYVM